MRSYIGIPESLEGIYWEFLSLLPNIIRKNQHKPNPEKLLGMECRFFTSNRCRSWCTKAHDIMNFAADFEYCEETGIVNDSVYENVESRKEQMILNDEANVVIEKSFNEFEKKIYEMHFVQNMSINEMSIKLKISRYKVNQIIQEFVMKFSKIFKQFI